MDDGYTIRAGREDDLAALPEIERQAGTLFAQAGWDTSIFSVIPVERHRAYCLAGRLWIAADAGDQPVGFAVASVIDGHVHLDELDVHPDHGRRGLGRRLIEQVCDWAQASGFEAVTLLTERDLPWNAPFYARVGFVILPDDALTPGLRDLRAEEVRIGLNTATRVAMLRRLV
jgi:GNAT superfamily N-acetyltransferase